MPDALRDEITFFGHIIQGNRITIKTDDMKVLNPDEDEIFEITIRRVLPPKSIRELEMSSFGKKVIDVLQAEDVFDDPQYMVLLFLHKHGIKGDGFRREDLSDSLIGDLCKATEALHQDKKLSDILRMKLERLRE
ncbi:MAG: hypothetical protein GWN18_20025 [Thermoplasmata archaeon]|nr:hypothetical protein [Thermoplasmata archaeon]NIS11119.1 hypothetical protein [Thermoplasmata archaeon]NIS22260.1 hypothetical protein [Thermoplasmata archaeon]NIT76117.1 hypothetical protein [Thermoplasmata archaeon]NIU51268.1 hypothetical protein [Thermoplasmata archaeon]